MATLAEIGRQRKAQLRQLKVASRKLDAAQESLEREINRIIARKKSVPELADAERLTSMSLQVEASLSAMVAVIVNVSQTWGIQFG